MVNVSVLFEDDQILVVDKPAGLIVDPAQTVKEQTLADILQKQFNIKLFRGGIVHRLDKDTSGVLVVAKTQEALEALQSQFKERKTKKEYLALVHGQIMEKGKIEASIGRNPGNREKFTVLDNGKEAVTEYQPISNLKFSSASWRTNFSELNKIQTRKLERMKYNEFTLLSCHPLTGRTHQIRVHLKYIGHPIVSDEKYVGRKIFRYDKRWCPRIFLHAKKLGFFHPGSGDFMEVESKLPEDLQKTLEMLNE